VKKVKAKTLYTLELYYEGRVSQSYATTDYEKAKRVYWKFEIRYGYPPRVTVDHVRLFTSEADRVFKRTRIRTPGKSQKTAISDAGCGVPSRAAG